MRLAHAGLTDVKRIVLATAAQHLDGALDLVLAADQRIDLALQRQLVEVGSVFAERIALALAAFIRIALAAGHAGRGFVADLGDAVGNVVHHVQARDFLLVQEVHRMGILLAEDRHQHVRAGDFLTAGRLHVIDRALQHALKTECGLSIAFVAVR
jgi:hypothetical protein